MRPRLAPLLLVAAFAACDSSFAPDVPEAAQSTSLLDAHDPATPSVSVSEGFAPQMLSALDEPVPDSVVVSWNGLEWVWASPCALGGVSWCGPENTVGKDGFEFATLEQWAQRPPVEAFGTADDFKCAAPWFDVAADVCNWNDAQLSTDDRLHDCCNLSSFGSAPAGVGGAAGQYGDPMHAVSETWLVRVADPRTKEDCRDGGWTNYGFRNQGQCVRFVETGKDSREA